MSDDEEYEQVELDQEQINTILRWALGAAGMIALMEFDDTDDEKDKLQGYEMAVSSMFESIPDFIMDAAISIANNTIAEVHKTEEIVEEFLEEIKDL